MVLPLTGNFVAINSGFILISQRELGVAFNQQRIGLCPVSGGNKRVVCALGLGEPRSPLCSVVGKARHLAGLKDFSRRARTGKGTRRTVNEGRQGITCRRLHDGNLGADHHAARFLPVTVRFLICNRVTVRSLRYASNALDSRVNLSSIDILRSVASFSRAYRAGEPSARFDPFTT